MGFWLVRHFHCRQVQAWSALLLSVGYGDSDLHMQVRRIQPFNAFHAKAKGKTSAVPAWNPTSSISVSVVWKCGALCCLHCNSGVVAKCLDRRSSFCFRVAAAVFFGQQACCRGNSVIRHQEEQD